MCCPVFLIIQDDVIWILSGIWGFYSFLALASIHHISSPSRVGKIFCLIKQAKIFSFFPLD